MQNVKHLKEKVQYYTGIAEGKEMQYRCRFSEDCQFSEWSNPTEEPNWYPSFNYEVQEKPKPVEHRVRMGLKCTLIGGLGYKYDGVFTQVGPMEYRIIDTNMHNRHADKTFHIDQVVRVGDQVENDLTFHSIGE